MELLDSRCGDCKRKLCQCSACARKDSQTKLNAKKEAAKRRNTTPALELKQLVTGAADAPAPAPAAASSAPSFSSDDEDQPEAAPYPEAMQPMQRLYLAADVVPDHELDPTLDQPPVAVARTLAKKSSTVRPAKKSLTADFNSAAAVVVPKIKLRDVLKSAKHNWIIKKIPRDGHCLFSSIVKGMIDHCIPSCPKTPEELRAACADQILAWNGVIPGRITPMFDKFGNILVQQARGLPEKLVTLEQYCNLVSSSLYGGLDEVFVIVQMYKLQIFVYSEDCYRGGDPEPEKVLLDCNLTEDAEENAGETNISVLPQLLTRSLFSSHLLLGPRIHLLLEKGKISGYGDHTSLMIHKHHHYAQMMSRLLDVDVDYRVCDDGKCGRGLEGIRRVEIGQVIERYDGHHVDSKGKVVFRMESVSALMRKYPQIDRERNNTPFQKTHAVRVGRRHESGLMVDGGPLTHPCLDHVKGVGRMALANSGSPKTSNMYVL